jgi:ammonia channel protein AmtB
MPEVGIVLVAPIWVFLILFAIAGVVKLIFGPRWKREAEERRLMFEARRTGSEPGAPGDR